jgi:hypothetical protein
LAVRLSKTEERSSEAMKVMEIPIGFARLLKGGGAEDGGIGLGKRGSE